jgi:hypothetical protein
VRAGLLGVVQRAGEVALAEGEVRGGGEDERPGPTLALLAHRHRLIDRGARAHEVAILHPRDGEAAEQAGCERRPSRRVVDEIGVGTLEPLGGRAGLTRRLSDLIRPIRGLPSRGRVIDERGAALLEGVVGLVDPSQRAEGLAERPVQLAPGDGVERGIGEGATQRRFGVGVAAFGLHLREPLVEVDGVGRSPGEQRQQKESYERTHRPLQSARRAHPPCAVTTSRRLHDVTPPAEPRRRARPRRCPSSPIKQKFDRCESS